ncbi:hypothetical protein D9756_010051 [Leucocoprinus leucothites]|uniref:Flavin-containing monooxygenase n=1 Tax=Leucocoprinus leucothites TaxID=201217 RepID=A0A8H5FR35_9AGAR|nr:hypothetical protein D9756_010051 [Leucoagaricus leucothites]
MRRPAGLVSYRNLSARGKFAEVKLYERRDDIGGVWYLDNNEIVNSSCTSAPPRWPSPAYPGLIGNVLPEFLSFSQFPFPNPTNPNQPFPTLFETHDYLRNFAEPFLKNGKIKLNIEVMRVEEQENGGWKVEIRDWNDGVGESRVEDWDAVVLAVGWYDHPVWPSTPGLDVLREKCLAQHAKWYRGPQGYEDKRVLVVGNANSGNEICAHLAPLARTPVYQSIRRPAFPGFPSLPDDRIHMVAPVARFGLSPSPYIPHSSTATDSSSSERGGTDKIIAHLQDGTILTDIDFVFIATGYEPNPDFVHVFDPNTTSHSPSTEASKGRDLMRLMDQNPDLETGTRVPSLHQHILYAHNPTLAFIGSPMSFTPFPINDISSLWLSLIWSLTIPLPEDLLHYETTRLEKIKKWRESVDNPSALYAYRVLGIEEEEYAESLRREVISVRPEMEEWFEMRWAPRELRRTWRERMYPMKLEALRYARDHGRN